MIKKKFPVLFLFKLYFLRFDRIDVLSLLLYLRIDKISMIQFRANLFNYRIFFRRIFILLLMLGRVANGAKKTAAAAALGARTILFSFCRASAAILDGRSSRALASARARVRGLLFILFNPCWLSVSHGRFHPLAGSASWKGAERGSTNRTARDERESGGERGRARTGEPEETERNSTP